MDFARTKIVGSIVGWLLRQLCCLFTLCHALLLSICTRLLPVKDRAPRRLPPSSLLREDPSGCVIGLEYLPPVPSLPEDERTETIAFAGCANLCCYTLGAAYAVQCAPNYSELRQQGKLRVAGGSSGALVGAFFAMDLDCSICVQIMRTRFRAHRQRLGGCIGIFSREVREILRSAMRTANAGRTDDPVSRLDGRLRVSVTRFNPAPQREVITSYPDEAALLDVVLASCFIPVAYESPVVLSTPGLGFCVDGCAMDFLPMASCVVSPYHSHSADIYPAVEYPTALVFSMVHADDVLKLFEDGYLDTVRWLEAHRPCRERERAAVCAQPAGGLAAFAAVALQAFLELLGLKRSWIECVREHGSRTVEVVGNAISLGSTAFT